MIRVSASLFFMLVAASVLAQGAVLTGRLVGPQGSVPFAAIVVLGSNTGSISDENGRFTLRALPAGKSTILISSVGFDQRNLTVVLSVNEQKDLGTIRLEATNTELEEVVVTGSLREVLRSESPVAIDIITPALFRKNPSPALFDAVGMVNGVRPQINCSVCNTGDIHINGMEGPYTMVLIDGMPIVSGLSTVYGLSGIPTSLIERVEVVKGPGSSLYGSEAMGGIINVITKDPVLAPAVSADVMGTTWQEYSADLGFRLGHGRVNDLVGVNLFNYDDPRDNNGDGFTDVTLQRRVSVFNKLGFRRPGRRVASLAGRYVHEDRWGGEMDWNRAFAGTDSIYGESIGTRRWELIGQYQLPLAERFMVQVSATGHQQRSFYGVKPFDADQRVFFGQLYWSRRVAGRHELLAGAAYRYTWYDDNTPATFSDRTNRPQRSPLPGLFVQDEWALNEFHTLLVGHRMDSDPNHGLVQSPRIAYKFAPSGKWAVRANFGTGYRVVNLFTEDHAALTGSRTVVITEDLRPERSLNGTLNVMRKWPGEKHFIGIDGSLFHTWFSNRILPDYTTDPELIMYRNLRGHGVSQGASLNLEVRVGEWWRMLAGATYMEVYTKDADAEGTVRRNDQYLAPKWSGTFTVSRGLPQRVSVDVSGQWYGPMRLPVLPNDFRPSFSPWYALLNVQVSHRVNECFEIYGGLKNLLDFVPCDPLMRPFDPFDRNVSDTATNPNGYTFDTSYMYAPLQGVRGFMGLRMVLDRIKAPKQSTVAP